MFRHVNEDKTIGRRVAVNVNIEVQIRQLESAAGANLLDRWIELPSGNRRRILRNQDRLDVRGAVRFMFTGDRHGLPGRWIVFGCGHLGLKTGLPGFLLIFRSRLNLLAINGSGLARGRQITRRGILTEQQTDQYEQIDREQKSNEQQPARKGLRAGARRYRRKFVRVRLLPLVF